MSNVNININELQQVLESTPADQNIMLVSNHGMGKSEVLTNFFQERGMKVVVFFASQMSDVGDLIGLPRKDEATGRTVFMPPYWWPKDGEPVVLFLDELSRARQEILQAVMDLALNRRLAGRPLPEGSRLVAAINYGDNYQTTRSIRHLSAGLIYITSVRPYRSGCSGRKSGC